MNIVTEYNLRRKNNCILAGPDSFCFFGITQPICICTTDFYPKSKTTCSKCGIKNDLTIEIFGSRCKLWHHAHIEPEQDIMPVIQNLFPQAEKMTGDSLELLWDLLCPNSRNKPIVEQLFHCSLNDVRLMNDFHRNYVDLIFGRNKL